MIFIGICTFGFFFVLIAVPLAWREQKRNRNRVSGELPYPDDPLVHEKFPHVFPDRRNHHKD